LNLFVAQLQVELDPAERSRLVVQIDAAVSAINELFNALLDMSKLEAGVLEPDMLEFPVQQLLSRVETTFTESARAKGLRLRVVPSAAWIRSDFILMERILFNLVSNAVRYTERGGIVVGSRRRGDGLRLEVWDSGPGIPPDQQKYVFSEFYRLAAPDRERRTGLGLGLAIVERLGRLLQHPVELSSWPGRGSCFAVSVPLVAERRELAEARPASAMSADPAPGKVIMVIDDDALVLDSMRGLLLRWGCIVATAASGREALARLAKLGRPADLIVSDYRLADGKSGIETIELLRGTLGVSTPAFLISGDTGPERLRDASTSGFLLLHKPVSAMTLRAVLNRFLKSSDLPVDTAPPAQPQSSRHSGADPRPVPGPR
jgi:two-component system, sensor histidine kinase